MPFFILFSSGEAFRQYFPNKTEELSSDKRNFAEISCCGEMKKLYVFRRNSNGKVSETCDKLSCDKGKAEKDTESLEKVR